MPAAIALGALALLFFYSAWAFNRMIRLKAWIDEAFSGIDVQLKRRHDLIPKLEAVVQGYVTHEKGTLIELAEARSGALRAAAGDLKARESAESAISGALPKIFALAEAYPQLKANENFLLLQKQISDIEDALQLARRYYNATVRDHNNFGQSFPMNLFQKQLGFQIRSYFMNEGTA